MKYLKKIQLWYSSGVRNLSVPEPNVACILPLYCLQAKKGFERIEDNEDKEEEEEKEEKNENMWQRA